MYYWCCGAFKGSGTGAGYVKVLGPLDVTIAAKTGQAPHGRVNKDREKEKTRTGTKQY
jgi:hypothetical protein